MSESALLVDTERRPEDSGPVDPRWELVLRVAASASFRKSRRLCDLLLFVCDRALREPGTALREHEIGMAVFGRPAEFDTSQDTLVRVQASQLRKRLQQYFSGDGAGEPIVIEIPKGTYLPVFREGHCPTPPDRQAPAHVPAPATKAEGRSHRLVLGLAGGLALALIGGLWLALANRQLERRLNAGLDPRPSVDALWRQVFGNGRHTYLVLADANLTIFEDLIHRQISPNDYQRQRFVVLPDQRLAEPSTQAFARKVMNRQFTSMADVGLARRIGLLNAAHGVPTDVVLARNAGPSHFMSHNAVLSGPRRANPWLTLFEDRLNFRSRFDEEEHLAYIDNLKPLPGEPPSYVVKWDRQGFCRVAYLPNLDATGSVLVISGTDLASSEAGAEFITSERWVRTLRSSLGLAARAPFPHFEALLRAQLAIGAAPSFELIAWRTLSP